MPNLHYRRRPRSSAEEDLDWLRVARDALRAADARAFAPGPWPLRAKAMDRVLKAMGVLQSELFHAIEEAHREAHGTTPPRAENDWLGYPPPRR